MAIIVGIETPSGITVAGAYGRIESYSGGKEAVAVEMVYYLNQQALQDGKRPVMNESYSFTPSVDDGADNIIKQGYEHVKTLPKFAGAVDC